MKTVEVNQSGTVTITVYRNIILEVPDDWNEHQIAEHGINVMNDEEKPWLDDVCESKNVFRPALHDIETDGWSVYGTTGCPIGGAE